MLKPIDLKKRPSNEMVIKRLNEALEIANKDSIDNCIVIMVDNQGNVIDGMANGSWPFVMLGVLEFVKSKVLGYIE